ncbi:hypothetical protein ACHAXA_009027 [Cyclostephanos tholiformis]|uniref:Uncharacterized protein n=1 Tax=Cyclostephanos tholiformis TaxID=382380 RepID=A0ABD3RE73_9STRA
MEDNDFECQITKSLIMSSVLIYNLLPIAGPATWATEDGKDTDSLYWYALSETRDDSTFLLRQVIQSCPNLIGVFAVGQKPYEDLLQILENTGTKVINDDCVMHSSVIYQGRADEYQ